MPVTHSNCLLETDVGTQTSHKTSHTESIVHFFVYMKQDNSLSIFTQLLIFLGIQCNNNNNESSGRKLLLVALMLAVTVLLLLQVAPVDSGCQYYVSGVAPAVFRKRIHLVE